MCGKVLARFAAEEECLSMPLYILKCPYMSSSALTCPYMCGKVLARLAAEEECRPTIANGGTIDYLIHMLRPGLLL